MRTIEFVEKLKSIDASVEIEQEYVLVLYNSMLIAQISRDDGNLADMSFSEYNETVIPDKEKRKILLNAICDYATTPLEERDKDDSKIIDMKISFEKLGLIVDLMEDALYGDELHINRALLKPLYFSLLDLWGRNIGLKCSGGTMTTEEFVNKIESLGLSAVLGLSEVHVFYEGGMVASIDRETENFASIDLDRDIGEPMMDSETRKNFFEIIYEYVTTPIKDRGERSESNN